MISVLNLLLIIGIIGISNNTVMICWGAELYSTMVSELDESKIRQVIYHIKTQLELDTQIIVNSVMIDFVDFVKNINEKIQYFKYF